MHVLIPDLHEDRTTIRQQLPRHDQTVPQIRQIRVNPVTPRVPERLHLLRLPADVLRLAVLDVTAGRRPLEVRIELNAVGRVEVDALHLAAQPLALGERAHHLQAVAEDHPVRPVGVVLIELRPGIIAGEPVEVGEQIRLDLRAVAALPGLPVPALPAQVVDEHLRVDLLLDEQRRRLHDEVGPVLRVLAAPDELGIEVAVAALVSDLDGALLGALHHGPELGRGDVLARRVLVPERLDSLPGSVLRHGHTRGRLSRPCTTPPARLGFRA